MAEALGCSIQALGGSLGVRLERPSPVRSGQSLADAQSHDLIPSASRRASSMLRAADCELVANAPARLQSKVARMRHFSQESFMVSARSVLAAILTPLALVMAGAASAGERCSAFDGTTLQCGRERVRVE